MKKNGTWEEEIRTEEDADAGEALDVRPPRQTQWLFRFIPALDSLRSYSWKFFRLDLIAGLTVAAVAVPQAMAYATAAGLQPHYGLYTAIVMTAVGALFDSSRQLINGPTNAISIALLSALAVVPEDAKLSYAVLLAFLMGVIQTAITLMRLGDLTRYISHSVIVGFTLGAALLLVMDQFKNLVGIREPTTIEKAAELHIERHPEGSLVPVWIANDGREPGVVGAYGGALRLALLFPSETAGVDQALERTLSELLHLERPYTADVVESSSGRDKTLLVRGIGVDELIRRLSALRWERDEHFISRFSTTMGRLGHADFWTAFIGLGSIGLILVLRWCGRRLGVPLPEFLLVIGIMAAVVWWFQLHKSGVAIVGSIPRQLPSFEAPEITWARTRELMGSALAIAILGLLEAIAMAKAIAVGTGQKLDINQQCLSEGVANLAGSFFQCFPGSGSLTRSSINVHAGAVSQWSGVMAAAAVALTVLLFAPLAYFIPRASLAGILMISAWRLVDRKQLMYHLRTTRFDAGIVLATALSAILVSVEFCILIGVFLSFVMFVPRAARMTMTELVLTPERVLRERQRGEPACGKILVFDLEGELFFGASADFDKHLERIMHRLQNGVRVVILRLKRVRNPDAVCLDLLDRFLTEMEKRRVTLLLCGVRSDLARVLSTSGLAQRFGARSVFEEKADTLSSTFDAVRSAYDTLQGQFCDNCPRRGEMKETLYYMI